MTESDATLRLMQDVYVEEADGAEIAIVTDSPPAVGNELLIELPPEDGHRPVLRVRVSEHTMVPCGEGMRYRVILRVLQRSTSSVVACVGVAP